MTTESTNDADLAALAHAAGIQVDWEDAFGQPQRVQPPTLRAMLNALELPNDSPGDIGESLERLRLQAELVPALTIATVGEPIWLRGAGQGVYRIDGPAGITGHAQPGDGGALLAPIDQAGYYTVHLGERVFNLAIAPSRCPGVDEATRQTDSRIWGPAAQVYSLRRDSGGQSAPAGGYGDFTALAQLARASAAQGAHALAISPVHAMFSADPWRYSPYGPSSRLFLNTLYADPATVLGEATVRAAVARLGIGAALSELEGAAQIDWPRAAQLRQRLLRCLFDDFNAEHPSMLHADFDAFRLAGGEALESHARFEVLHARVLDDQGRTQDWRRWPKALHDASGEPVRAFVREHPDDVRFHIFAQWLASRGLRHAQQSARDAGMAIGLIADLAVGTDPGGSQAWSRQNDLLIGLSSGAPPDLHNPLGQGWGLTAFSPRAMRANGYAAFIEMLRAVMSHAGGVRIDHVLGLARTWLVPDTMAPTEGAYLRYPFDDMLKLIALEAWRHKTIVIGENLGTIPPGFDDKIHSAGVAGINVLWFQHGYPHHDGTPSFKSPSQWPRENLSMSTTHDLATVAGWWLGRDLDWRARLGIYAAGETEADLRMHRESNKRGLEWALRDNGAWDRHPPIADEPPIQAILDFTASSPSALVLIPLEDIAGQTEQPNIPGTVDTHPNWMRRMDTTVNALFDEQAPRARAGAVQAARARR